MKIDLKELIGIFQEEENKTATARAYCKKHNITYSDTLRRRISEILSAYSSVENIDEDLTTNTKTDTKEYTPDKKFVLSAWNKDTGKIMDIDEYCEKYNLPREDISSFKFLPHHYSEPSYNIAFRKKEISEDDFSFDDVKKILTEEIDKVYTYSTKESKHKSEGVLKWADLHFGALIENLLKTKDFNSDILREGLMMSVDDFNSIGFSKRHVHIQGDLIESFSGLNHINSWQSMDKNMIGANAVKMCCKLIHEAVSKIENLSTIKITAGNHDRLSKNNDEDVKGGAAELIAWGLELMGYDVEFHPYVITHKVDNINYINLHGDKKLSGKTSEEIASLYGVHGCYNLITEAHLHTAMEKLTATQRSKFNVIKDDKLKLRRITLKPFFTGNYYSETLGYNTNAGYSIFWSNERGLPKILDNTI